MKKEYKLGLVLPLILRLGFLSAGAVTPLENISDELSRLMQNPLSFETGASSYASLMPQNILSFAVEVFKDAFLGKGSFVFTLIAITVLSSVIEMFSSNLGGSSRVLSYALLLTNISACLAITTPLIETVSEFFERFSAFMTAMSGTVTVIAVSSGGTASATVSSASATFIASTAQVCAVHIILPCIRTVVALCAINALSGTVDLGGIISFIKSFCTWGLGVIFAVFGGVHSVAVAVSSSADSLAVRGIRFSAARLIPIAGNMISESMKTVLAGMNVIRTTAGGLGIAYVIYTVLPVLASVLSVKLAISCGAFCSRLFGAKAHTAFLESIGSAINILTAICLFVSAIGIIIFAVFIRSGISVG